MFNNFKQFPPVAFIIPHYINIKDTLRCLRSIKNCNYFNLKIFLIDLSNDFSEKNIEFASRFKLQIIKSANIGYGGACNMGIRKAIDNGFNYFLILNSDTQVEKNFLKPLIEKALNEPQTIFSPVIINGYNEKIEVISQKFTYSRAKVFSKLHSDSIDIIEDLMNKGILELETDVHCGCVIFLTRHQYEALSGFNEKYFLYSEDIDLSLRAKKIGFKLKVVIQSNVFHFSGGSTGGKDSIINIYYNSRNRILLAKEHFSFVQKVSFFVIFTVMQVSKTFFWLLKGEFKKIKVLIEAFKDGLMGKTGINKQISSL